MAWLAKTIFTPDEAGMVPVDPRRPIDVFFGWNNSAQLTLMKNGERVGQITVAGFDGKQPNGETRNGPGFSISGTLDKLIDDDRGNTISTVGMFGRSLIEFKDDLSIGLGKFLFRIPSSDLSVQAAIEGENQDLTVKAVLGGRKIFSYDGATQSEEELTGFGMGNAIVKKTLDSVGDPSQLKWELEAFRGIHRMAGRRFPAYLMKFSVPELDQELRIYFSESGEPLQIDSDLGYQAMSEMLVPLDAFRRRS